LHTNIAYTRLHLEFDFVEGFVWAHVPHNRVFLKYTSMLRMTIIRVGGNHETLVR